VRAPADTAKRAGDYASQVKDRITDTASDYASQMKDRISDTASSYADSVADFAGDARRRAKPKRRCNRACSACCASNSSPSRSPVWRRVPRSPRYFPRPTSRTAHSAARTKLARTWTQGALQSESTMVAHHSPPEHNAL
jgi:hypothetical protein